MPRLRMQVQTSSSACLLDSLHAFPSSQASHEPPCPAVPPQVVCYDIEVVTGSLPGAGTTSKVYLELVGGAGSSGEHRLMYRAGSGRTAFAAGATDTFQLHCAPLGELLKVRGRGGEAAVQGRWLAGSDRGVRRCTSTMALSIVFVGMAPFCQFDLSALPVNLHPLLRPRCVFTTATRARTPPGGSRRCGCGSRTRRAGPSSPAAAGWQCTRTTGGCRQGQERDLCRVDGAARWALALDMPAANCSLLPIVVCCP